MVATASHTAATGLLLAQRVLAPDASQDYDNHRIRRVDISTGATTTLAGSGELGWNGGGFKDDDVSTSVQFNLPFGVEIDPSGTFALVSVRV